MASTTNRPQFPDAHCPWYSGDVCPARVEAVRRLWRDAVARRIANRGFGGNIIDFVRGRFVSVNAPTKAEVDVANANLSATDAPGCVGTTTEWRQWTVAGLEIPLGAIARCGHDSFRSERTD